MWILSFDDGYRRPVKREFDTEEAALKEACSLRQRYDVISIEGPGGRRYDATAILDWCIEHKM
jgi:hypothetical protein